MTVYSFINDYLRAGKLEQLDKMNKEVFKYANNSPEFKWGDKKYSKVQKVINFNRNVYRYFNDGNYYSLIAKNNKEGLIKKLSAIIEAYEIITKQNCVDKEAILGEIKALLI